VADLDVTLLAEHPFVEADVEVEPQVVALAGAAATGAPPWAPPPKPLKKVSNRSAKPPTSPMSGAPPPLTPASPNWS